MHEYTGAIHMHSTFSDGTGKPDEIAGFASEVGLDYIILTDHNNIGAKTFGFEKWYDGTMMIVGYELNDLGNRNHYLVFGLDKLVGTFKDIGNNELGCELSVKEYVRQVKDLGGTGFIAHPFEKRNHFPEHPPYPWTYWNTDYFDGIEIWNHMSEWVEDLNDKNKFQRFLHPLKSIVQPCKEAVQKWDELNKKRKVVAIGSVDAHAHKQSFLGFYKVEVFPYKVLFKSIRTNVILDEEIKKNDMQSFEHFKNLIIKSLREGRSYITNSYWGDARGFRFFAEYNNEIYELGDEIIYDTSASKKIVFRTYAPKDVTLKFVKNGICIDECTGTGGVWDVDESGNYRVECWLGDKAWIFSNHIRVLNSL